MEQQEKQRLEAVNNCLQLDYEKSSEFQDIVDLAAQLCNVPIALITLLDKDINWLKVRKGTSEASSPREISFCQYSIRQSRLLIVPDATKDPRFCNNPLVVSDPKIRFYAGAPLTLINGLRVGTLCLFDSKPGNITPLQQKMLVILAKQVTFLMELGFNQKQLHEHEAQIAASNMSLTRIAHIQSHEIRRPLTYIMGLVNSIKEDNYIVDREQLIMMEEAAFDLDTKIRAIVKETKK